MNFKPNFEQYKADQKKLEVVPSIKPETHFLLNDISKKIIENQEPSQEEIDTLEMIYDMTQDIERNFVGYMDQYRSKEVISKSEFLATVGYFLIAHQNGPETEPLKNEMILASLDTTTFNSVSEKISIPEYTRLLLNNIYEKISSYKRAGLLEKNKFI